MLNTLYQKIKAYAAQDSLPFLAKNPSLLTEDSTRWYAHITPLEHLSDYLAETSWAKAPKSRKEDYAGIRQAVLNGTARWQRGKLCTIGEVSGLTLRKYKRVLWSEVKSLNCVAIQRYDQPGRYELSQFVPDDFCYLEPCDDHAMDFDYLMLKVYSTQLFIHSSGKVHHIHKANIDWKLSARCVRAKLPRSQVSWMNHLTVFEQESDAGVLQTHVNLKVGKYSVLLDEVQFHSVSQFFTSFDLEDFVAMLSTQNELASPGYFSKKLNKQSIKALIAEQKEKKGKVKNQWANLIIPGHTPWVDEMSEVWISAQTADVPYRSVKDTKAWRTGKSVNKHAFKVFDNEDWFRISTWNEDSKASRLERQVQLFNQRRNANHGDTDLNTWDINEYLSTGGFVPNLFRQKRRRLTRKTVLDLLHEDSLNLF